MNHITKTRREIEDENRTAHILNVAERLFAQKGLFNTSVSEIAQDAEFGVGTIYKYFKDKNTLIETLLSIRLTEHFDMLEQSINAAESPMVLIDNFIEAYFSSIKSKKLFFKIYFTNFHPGGQLLSESPIDVNLINALHEKKRAILNRISDIFERGTKEGCFADVGGAKYMAFALYGLLLSFYFLTEFEMNDEIDVKKLKTTLKKILFEQNLISKK
jgi:AcrR family transcriptional regulator